MMTMSIHCNMHRLAEYLMRAGIKYNLLELLGVCQRRYIYIYIYTCMHVSMYICIYIYTYTHVYIYIYIYIYTHIFPCTGYKVFSLKGTTLRGNRVAATAAAVVQTYGLLLLLLIIMIMTIMIIMIIQIIIQNDNNSNK